MWTLRTTISINLSTRFMVQYIGLRMQNYLDPLLLGLPSLSRQNSETSRTASTVVQRMQSCGFNKGQLNAYTFICMHIYPIIIFKTTR